jgi:hypothetical protein
MALPRAIANFRYSMTQVSNEASIEAESRWYAAHKHAAFAINIRVHIAAKAGRHIGDK